jgi:hypothetical protein
MKVTFKVAVADYQRATITMENVVYPVAAFRSAMNSFAWAFDATYAYLTLSIDKTVQGAGSYDVTLATYTAAPLFEVLSNDGFEAIQNIQAVTVSLFQRGVSYLIPAATVAPLNLVPANGFDVGGSAQTLTAKVFATSHYPFDCPADTTIQNQTSIAGCYTFQKNGAVIAAKEQQKAVAKTVEVINFQSATGNPTAQVAAAAIANPAVDSGAAITQFANGSLGAALATNGARG